jgi:hypothetical protein
MILASMKCGQGMRLTPARIFRSPSGSRHGEAMSITPLVCKPAELPERLDGLATQGITEVAFQPMRRP